MIEMGFGGPVLIGALKSPDVTRLSHFLERNGIPFRVVDPDADSDASLLLERYAPLFMPKTVAVVGASTVLPPNADVYLYRDLPDEVVVPFDIPVEDYLFGFAASTESSASLAQVWSAAAF